MSKQPTIFLITGELSGDLHMSRHIPDLRKRFPEAKIMAVGGPHLQKAGVRCFVDIAELNCMGFFHVIRRLPQLWRTYQTIRQAFQTHQPILSIFVDSPALNLRLLKTAKHFGQCIYYIAPKLWAHGENRVHRLKHYCDHLALIFPFEVHYFQNLGIPCSFVGNPVLSTPLPHRCKKDARQALNLPDTHIIALLPGSRPQEVKRHLPTLCQAAASYQQKHPHVRFILPWAPTISAEDQQLPECVQAFSGQSISVMQAADAAIVVSGTATLEVAHCQTPMVIVYQASALTAWWVRRFTALTHIGLPNILAQKTICPEVLQNDFCAQSLTKWMDTLSPNQPAWHAQRKALLALTESFKPKTSLIDILTQLKSLSKQ